MSPVVDPGVAQPMDDAARLLATLKRLNEESAHLAGRGRAAFLSEGLDGELFRNAAERILMRAAALAGSLDSGLRESCKGVDWQAVELFARLADHVEVTGGELLWRSLTTRLPRFLDAVEDSLGRQT